MKRNFTLLLLTLLMWAVAMPQSASADNVFTQNRTDFRDETIYFAMTTRFYDGDPTNNVCGWDHQDVQIANGDPDWRGDFKGLIDRLDYIKALGFTAIWITPVVQNCSGTDFHGYHAMDMSKVDLRYESRKKWGASEDVTFQSLIDAAHAKGMKIILDIVLNHTGNFGEAYLNPLFTRSQNIKDQASVSASIIPNYDRLPANYNDLTGAKQYEARFKYFKQPQYDNHNYYHHYATGWNWDYPNRWWGQIAGDCVDLNTENNTVAEYLVKCYGEFIKMGVDGFRIDTTGHISRLTFNKQFIPQFLALGEQYKSKRLNGCPFYMFGECCARYSDVTYRNQANLSSYFYTWKSPQSLLDQYDGSQAYWDTQVLPEGHDSPVGPMALCEAETEFNETSDNVFMQNGAWHEPDYSQASGFNIIDFPMHYNFNSAGAAVNVAKSGDHMYNDASFNVVYVDSHDYCPGPNDGTRFNGGTAQWAENLSLMFTFRGIPCLYYGSEVEFKKGCKVDAGGTAMPVKDSGRAYFGEYLEGSVTATDFCEYTASGNVAQTLNADLAQHIIRLNKIRASVPALRKGQYTWDGCTANGGYAFKRAYQDSYALVAINGGATFTDCPDGTYVDLVTGQSYTPAGGTITVTAPATQGQLRVLVKGWTGGKVGDDGQFIYTTSPVAKGGSVTFEDKPTTSFYTADDATGQAGIVLTPAGGSFTTETLNVTAKLNDAAVSGWYQIGGGSRVNIPASGTSFTIGEGMSYGETVTVNYGATDDNGNEITGSAKYKKADPNATITIYVKAAAAPNLYAWTKETGSTVELNGAWPGKTLSDKKTVGGQEFWYMTFADVTTVNVIFNSNGNKTLDIEGITEDRYFEYDGGTGYTDITSSITPEPEDPTDIKVTADKKSGTYYEAFDVTLTASKSDATIVYTLDGTDPTANSTQATGSVKLNITATTTVKAGALVDGTVKNIVSYAYTITERPQIEGINIYVKASSAPHLYAWTTETGSTVKLNGAWPGELLSEEVTVDGETYYYQHLDASTANIIFNNGNGSQTGDITGLTTGNWYYSWNGGGGYELLKKELGETPVDPDPVDPTQNYVEIYVQSTIAPHIYAWNDNGKPNGEWPGTQVAEQQQYNNQTWWYQRIEGAPVNIILNSGSNQGQTQDIKGLAAGKHFFTWDGGSGYSDITAQIPTGITNAASVADPVVNIYNTNGVCVAKMAKLSSARYTLQPGVYIVNGRKFYVR